MVSALDELDSAVRCIEAGAEDYLPNPFNPVLLRAHIAACLERKRLLDELRTEQERSEALLLNILPRAVIARMRQGETEIADLIPETIGFGFLGGALATAPYYAAPYFGRELDFLDHGRRREEARCTGQRRRMSLRAREQTPRQRRLMTRGEVLDVVYIAGSSHTPRSSAARPC